MTEPTPKAEIRRAVVADVPMIAKLINDSAEYGLMLPRSLAHLYENVRGFHVAQNPCHPTPEPDPPPGTMPILGVCGLSVVWANLAEVMSLVVAPGQRRRGIGAQLVEACLAEARLLGIRRVMTLTYEQPFFTRLEFVVVDRSQLPLKVWSECLRCPKNQDCDEIAMVRELQDVPETIGPEPTTLAADRYVVPIVRKIYDHSRLEADTLG